MSWIVFSLVMIGDWLERSASSRAATQATTASMAGESGLGCTETHVWRPPCVCLEAWTTGYLLEYVSVGAAQGSADCISKRVYLGPARRTAPLKCHFATNFSYFTSCCESKNTWSGPHHLHLSMRFHFSVIMGITMGNKPKNTIFLKKHFLMVLVQI